jgi:predicted metalloprotease with PDZ domain
MKMIFLILLVLGSQTAFLSREAFPQTNPQSKSAAIAYRIHVDRADLSGFDVEMRIRGGGEVVRVAMAAHPEYDDRYWRYVENLTAESPGAKLQITNDESAVWSIQGAGGDVTVKYRLHLPTPSTPSQTTTPQTTQNRAAYVPFLSPTGGLIGDVHSLMYVVGAESVPATVTLELPDGWKSASGLEPTKDPQTFSARSVELLLDSPIVVGEFQQWNFEVEGLKHQVVYLTQPNAATFDTAAFVAGIQKLVIEALKIGGKAPYKNSGHYTFLYQDGAVGALEHINSVTIGARSQSLAQGLQGVFETTAHEYFHTWNLMHVRPTERVGLHYHPAEDTAQLWWSEGVTIYFADLMMRRAKLPTSDPTRLAHLENLMASYFFNPAYARFSAEQVSRAAEDPLGLGDYSASTHFQGNMLGTMLDLMILESTQGRRSLSDVMRRLSDSFTPQRGITGRDIEQTVSEVCACDARPFFEAYVRGARPIDFDRYLLAIGMRAVVSWSPALNSEGKPEPDLRVFALNVPEDSALRLRIINPNSVWGRAGLHTGDRLIAIDGKPVATSTEFRSWVSKLHVGDTANVQVESGGAVSKVAVVIAGYDRSRVKIEEIAGATSEQKRLRAQWQE